MATLNLYLRKYKRMDGTAQVRIMVCHHSKTSYLPTNINVEPEQWDSVLRRVINHPQKNQLNNILDIQLTNLKLKIVELYQKGTLKRLNVEQLCSVLSGGDENPHLLFMPALRKYIESCATEGTKSIYTATERRLLDFLKGRAELLTFEDITPSFLTQFEKHLAMTAPKQNSRSIHLRNIRTVFNAAIDDEVTTYYPFRKFRIKSARTFPRALTVEQLRLLWEYKHESSDSVNRALDYFKLIFLTIGLNPSDLVNLKNITATGRLEYMRKKTHRPYSIKVEDEAREIIERRKGQEFLVEAGDIYSNGRDFARVINKNLKKIPDFYFLSTYWARHTWATLASSIDIPKETIAAALGHAANSVTDIYIAFDQSKVDRANRRVIDYVLYNKQTATW